MRTIVVLGNGQLGDLPEKGLILCYPCIVGELNGIANSFA
jgi:hypothetical protein